MKSEKGFSLPINLVLAMTVLVILAAIVALITSDYTTQFQVFGSNQSTGFTPFG